MKRPKPPAIIAALVCTAILAGILWLWWIDYPLIDDCRDHGGQWNADTRVCELKGGTYRLEQR